MANVDLEVRGYLERLIDIGASASATESGVARRVYVPQQTLVDASGVAISLGSGVVQPVSIDQTTPGTTNYAEIRSNTRRSAGVVHRSAITAIDKCLTPSAPTGADVLAVGSLNFNTAYNFAVAASTIHGTTPGSATGTVTTSNNAAATHGINVTVAQVAGATAYDIFLSTDAQPKLVGRVTEAQRAAGTNITAMGVVGGATPGAGIVQVQVVGTGLANNVAPFTVNNAYVTAGITPVDCRGFGVVLANWKLAVTDLRSLPTLAFTVFWLDNQSAEYRFFGNVVGPSPTLLTAIKQPLTGVLQFNTQGSSSMVVLVDTISGQGAAASVNVELA